MDQIFISYAREDIKAKETLRSDLIQKLDNRKFNVWDDSQLAPGDFALTIEQEIKKSCIFIILISKDFVQSDFVRKEIDWIKSQLKKKNRLLIPIILKDYSKDSISKQLPEISQYQLYPKNYESLTRPKNKQASWNENLTDICIPISEKKPCKGWVLKILGLSVLLLVSILTVEVLFNKSMIISSTYLEDLVVEENETVDIVKSENEYHTIRFKNNSTLNLSNPEDYVLINAKKIIVEGSAKILGRGEKGISGADGTKGANAQSDCLFGSSGNNGQNGEDGSNGKDLILKLERVNFLNDEVQLKIDLSGGNGGTGGNGGAGGAGGKADCSSNCRGGNGGNGGNAGGGGNAGDSGIISINDDLIDESNNQIIIETIESEPGLAGNPGIPGNAGSGKSCFGFKKGGGASGTIGKKATNGKIVLKDRRYLDQLNPNLKSRLILPKDSKQ